MKKFDRSRPHGKITPGMAVAGCDRMAIYEQDGELFDAHGLPYFAGSDDVPEAKPAVSAIAATSEAEEAPMTVDSLIAVAASLPYQRLLKQAKAVLGPTCPSGKQPIIEALAAAKAAYEERQASKRTAIVVAEPVAVAPTIAVASPPSKSTSGIDLAAWGRGQKDYLFGEVQKAMRTVYHKQVSERRDAVEFLVEQKVITSQQARRDV